MGIRLSGAQVTRIQEFLIRYEESGNNEYAALYGSRVPRHLAVETLVEDILKEVVPECNPSEHQIQKEQRSVNI